MAKFIIETITTEADGYKYGDRDECRARSPRAAAMKYGRKRQCEAVDESLVVVVREPEWPNRIGDVFELDISGDVRARQCVTPVARDVVRRLMALIHEIRDLAERDAISFLKTMESIHIDSLETSELEDEHPATSDMGTISLNGGDVLAGFRLFMHVSHDLPYIDMADENLAAHGGFSPEFDDAE